MKSIVFSFKKSKFEKRNRKRITIYDLRYFFKRYGIFVLFSFLMLAGLAFGSVYSKFADSAFIKSLDFLFTTNFDTRLAQNAIGIFCSCFASDFIFLLATFLLGFTPWGIPFLIFLSFFKGFGTGITAGFLFASYSMKGVGFYLLIILPGTFIFCMALALCSTYAFSFSKHMFFYTLKKDCTQPPLRSGMLEFSSHSVTSLIATFCAAVLDTVLWLLFAGAFNF